MDMPKDDFRTRRLAAVTRRFAAVIRQRATAAGYDVDSPRGGGKTALAADTGMSLASVSRMLSGQVIPEARFLTPLATALRMDVLEIFVLADLLPEMALDSTPRAPRPLTAAEAALDLGITEPEKIALFKAIVGNLLGDGEESEQTSTGKGRQ